MDDFIGKEFITPKGGVLTVLGTNGLKGSKKKYKLSCNLCHNDPEMFPDLFQSSKYSLEKRGCPCGCAKSPQWSVSQFKIRIIRKCIELDYEFIDFNGKFKGNGTKMILKCNNHSHRWGTTRISTLLGYSRGCNFCGSDKISEKLTVPDEEMIKRFFRSNKFIEGTIFTKNTEKITHCRGNHYWDTYCPKCSNDEYVKAGLCSGVFTSYRGSLQAGNMPCRCSSVNWTEGQREYQIIKIANKEGLSFEGWIQEVFDKSNTKFKWFCKEGHSCTSLVRPFVDYGLRCKRCAELNTSFGLNKKRVDDEDTLYLLVFKDNKTGEVFIKIGRSFEFDNRILYFRKKYNVTLLSSIKGRHEDIFYKEQELHKLYDSYKHSPIIPFGGSIRECFDMRLSEEVLQTFNNLRNCKLFY